MKYMAGVFAVAGTFGLGWHGGHIGNAGLFGGGYKVVAEFGDVGGLEGGDTVSIAGIRVGSVESVSLREYQAEVVMRLDDGVEIRDDSVASIKTKSLLGGKYVQITPGGSDRVISDGGKLRETESAMDPERLISSYVFGKV